jgi:hypothetical protein
MLKLFFVFVLLAGWGLAAISLHIVRTPAGLTILPKDTLSITDTYADTRDWKPTDLPEHKALIKRLLSTDRMDAVRHVIEQDHDASVKQQLIEASEKPATKSNNKSKASVPLARVAADHGVDLAWGN